MFYLGPLHIIDRILESVMISKKAIDYMTSRLIAMHRVLPVLRVMNRQPNFFPGRLSSHLTFSVYSLGILLGIN